MERTCKWTIRNKKSNISNVYEELKATRNLEDIADFFDPFKINDMDKAVERILKAIEKKERVLIYGDYDCDGIFSTVILYRFLKDKCDCEYMIPDRFSDGYGLSMEKCSEIACLDFDLVITVDCGITSIDETRFLMEENGIDVIITDHHTCQAELPPALAVLDCKRVDNTYPFNEVCGAGLALKLVHAICLRMDLGNVWEDYLEYAAIATIADVVPLVSENRKIVKDGLKMLKKTEKPAFQALFDEVADTIGTDITSQNIAFYICPRINAASRMGHLEDALALFLSDDLGECLVFAESLTKYNSERKEIEKEIFEESCKKIVATYDFNSFSPIVVCGEDWHSGVLGIVASKIQELFCRPAIVLSKEKGSDIYHGSCRTFGNINLYDILKKREHFFEKFGGHKKAAGLSIASENVVPFIKDLKDNCEIRYDDCVPSLDIEMLVPLSVFSMETMTQISELEPFGESNPTPIFASQNLAVKNAIKIGKEKNHLRLVLSDGKNTYSALYFNAADIASLLPGAIVDIAFRPSVSTYMNKKSITFFVEDIHFNISSPYLFEEAIMFSSGEHISSLFDDMETIKSNVFFTKEQFSYVYKSICNYLMIYGKGNTVFCALDKLTKIFEKETKGVINSFKFITIIDILSECGYINSKIFLDSEEICLSFSDTDNKKSLKDSKTYNRLKERID